MKVEKESTFIFIFKWNYITYILHICYKKITKSERGLLY